MALNRLPWLLSLCAVTALAQVPNGAASASGETAPFVTGPTAGGDVAIWLAPGSAKEALILGVDPSSASSGFSTYRLDGGLFQSVVGPGPTTAIDVVHSVRANGGLMDVVAVTTAAQQLLLYTPTGAATAGTLSQVGSAVTLPYPPVSAAMARTNDGGLYVYVGDYQGHLMTYQQGDPAGPLAVSPINPPRVYTDKFNALVVDEGKGRLWAVVDNVGLYRIPLYPDKGDGTIAVPQGANGLLPNTNSLAIYSTGDAGALLISGSTNPVSAETTFQIFSIEWGEISEVAKEIGRFTLDAGAGREGVAGSRGLAVANLALGFGYDKGLLVAHDALNASGPNLKLVRWDELASSASPRFPVDVRVDPRTPIGKFDGGGTTMTDGGMMMETDGGSDGGSVTPGGCDAGTTLLADGGCGKPTTGRDGGTSGGGGGVSFPSDSPSCGCGSAPMGALLGVTALLLSRRRSRRG